MGLMTSNDNILGNSQAIYVESSITGYRYENIKMKSAITRLSICIFIVQSCVILL